MSRRGGSRAHAFMMAAIASAALAAPVSAAPAMAIRAVSAIDMIERAALLDGSKVVFTGEAIGQVMQRGSMAWVNVGDSGGAIGVWMDAETAAAIRTLGSYRFRGDELRVTGTYSRACGEHGGDMDIHADLVEILRPGERTAHPLDAARLVAAVIASLAAATALFLLRARDARRREAETSRGRSRNGGSRSA